MRTAIEMAREAGEILDKEWLKRLVEFARADEREACAQIADQMTQHSYLGSIGQAIRNRNNT